VESSAGGGREESEEACLDPNCGYYLRNEHRLIRRHEESLSLNADNTARWKLRVDLELPDHCEAHIPDGDACLFMFPLVFLRKNESRMQFSVFEQGRGPVPIPIREECDNISSEAVSQAINFLASEIHPDFHFEEKALEVSASKIPSAQAFEASMALQVIREEVGILPFRDKERGEPQQLLQSLGKRMRSSGLDETLELLVEHVLLWVPLRGRPNERRSITLEQDVTLHRRSLVRWSFGSMTDTAEPRPWWNRRWARLARGEGEKGETLEIGGKPYGRRERRFSTSSLGARFGQLLAWMPFEFALPTIYAKRCGSYHFEVVCPPGRTPRGLEISNGSLLEESKEPKPAPIEEARKAFTARGARFDVPRGGLQNVAKVHVKVGIGDGAVTTVMLWILAGSDPGPRGDHAQTTAGVLLIVPALVAALAAGTYEVPISQLVAGARVLLLTTGLSSVMAAAVLAGARPFDLSQSSIWSLCAVVATVATVPLATSWLLSSPLIWRQLNKLDSYRKQRATLIAGVSAAALLVLGLAILPADTWYRLVFVGLLLLAMILFSTLASNRAVMPLGVERRYLGSGFLLAGLTCLALACVELRCVIYEHALSSRVACVGPMGTLETIRGAAESVALGLLAISLYIGRGLSWVADWAEPREDEIHLSPRQGRVLLEGESVRELPALFEREKELEGVRVGMESARPSIPLGSESNED
jgi:hypothetical protein